MARAELRGIAASTGIAIGRAFVLREPTLTVERAVLDQTELPQAISCFREAHVESRRQLEGIRERVRNRIGQEEAGIFDAHLLMLEDTALTGEIERLIADEAAHPVCAVERAVSQLAETLETLDDEYLRERAADMRDIGRRIQCNLIGVRLGSLAELDQPSIVIGHDLAPSDTAQADRSKVLGFATEIGGRTSHTALMARTLEIPAVVGTGSVVSAVSPGDWVVIDAVKGKVLVNPTEDELSAYQERQKAFLEERKGLRSLKDLPPETVDGHRVELAANIGNPEEATPAREWGAEGVGLFRTEFLFMNRDRLPTEDEQYLAYRTAAEVMNPYSVIIRTLDIGGDKKVTCFEIPEEMNPFLGWRAIRICLDRRDIFKTQLKALFRAGVHGNIKIMFPMIAARDELVACREVVEEVKEELAQQGIPFEPKIPVGIMVETPAAAVSADLLAPLVDFFSIGTNDLIQYTMAADRMNQKVSYLYEPLNPSVLRLIRQTISAGRALGKMVGMCGEMAGEPYAIPVLLGLGLDEFSMSAASIPVAKKIIRHLSMDEARSIAERVLLSESPEESRSYLGGIVDRILGRRA